MFANLTITSPTDIVTELCQFNENSRVLLTFVLISTPKGQNGGLGDGTYPNGVNINTVQAIKKNGTRGNTNYAIGLIGDANERGKTVYLSARRYVA